MNLKRTMMELTTGSVRSLARFFRRMAAIATGKKEERTMEDYLKCPTDETYLRLLKSRNPEKYSRMSKTTLNRLARLLDFVINFSRGLIRVSPDNSKNQDEVLRVILGRDLSFDKPKARYTALKETLIALREFGYSWHTKNGMVHVYDVVEDGGADDDDADTVGTTSTTTTVRVFYNGDCSELPTKNTPPEKCGKKKAGQKTVAESVAEANRCPCHKGDSDKKSDGTGSLLGDLAMAKLTLDIADSQLMSVAKSVAESGHCSCRKGVSDKKSDGMGSLLGGLTAVGLTLDIVDSLITSAVGRLKHGDRK